LSHYLAKVVKVTEIPATETSPRYGLLDIAFPLPAVASDVGSLIAVIFGKVSMSGKIRLVDLKFPPELVQERMAGPRFGIDGIRQKVNVTDPSHPLLMSIFKPCLGLSAQTLGTMFYEQAVGGVNLVKDDEILSDNSLDSARRRLEAVLKAGEKARAETGRPTLYAINLTGPAHELLDRARVLVQDGATAFLFNYLAYGLPMLASLRQDDAIGIPLMAHPALAGAFYGSPAHGIDPQVIFGRLPRLAGADIVLFPSPYGSVALPQADALSVAQALREDCAGLKPSYPVPSAGIKAQMAPQILQDFGPQVIVNAGTGIHDYPQGPVQGVRAFREAIQQVVPSYPVGEPASAKR
jgi:2,3-diketo-5-methylthiopentyl-1-phosphate enolase